MIFKIIIKNIIYINIIKKWNQLIYKMNKMIKYKTIKYKIMIILDIIITVL